MKVPPSHSQTEESNNRSTSVIFNLLHYTTTAYQEVLIISHPRISSQDSALRKQYE